MGIFGWDYPPGCSGTPYDETQEIDITRHCILRGNAIAVFWDEYDNLIEATPHEDKIIGEYPWSDEKSDEQNIIDAGAHYNSLGK